MSVMDTARALKKLLAGRTVTQGKDAGIRKLSTDLGKSPVFILGHLNLLKESEEIMGWLEKPESKYFYQPLDILPTAC